MALGWKSRGHADFPDAVVRVPVVPEVRRLEALRVPELHRPADDLEVVQIPPFGHVGPTVAVDLGMEQEPELHLLARVRREVQRCPLPTPTTPQSLGIGRVRQRLPLPADFPHLHLPVVVPVKVEPVAEPQPGIDLGHAEGLPADEPRIGAFRVVPAEHGRGHVRAATRRWGRRSARGAAHLPNPGRDFPPELEVEALEAVAPKHIQPEHPRRPYEAAQQQDDRETSAAAGPGQACCGGTRQPPLARGRRRQSAPPREAEAAEGARTNVRGYAVWVGDAHGALPGLGQSVCVHVSCGATGSG